MIKNFFIEKDNSLNSQIDIIELDTLIEYSINITDKQESFMNYYNYVIKNYLLTILETEHVNKITFNTLI
jgi:hypothetical protein